MQCSAYDVRAVAVPGGRQQGSTDRDLLRSSKKENRKNLDFVFTKRKYYKSDQLTITEPGLTSYQFTR